LQITQRMRAIAPRPDAMLFNQLTRHFGNRRRSEFRCIVFTDPQRTNTFLEVAVGRATDRRRQHQAIDLRQPYNLPPAEYLAAQPVAIASSMRKISASDKNLPRLNCLSIKRTVVGQPAASVFCALLNHLSSPCHARIFFTTSSISSPSQTSLIRSKCSRTGLAGNLAFDAFSKSRST